MHSRTLRSFLCLFPLLVASGLGAQPGSGTRWEVKMQMPGMDPQMQAQMEAMQKEMQGMELPEGMQMPDMGGGFMTQTMCLPQDTDEPPPADEGCTLLEQRSAGSRHFVRMQCPDGLIEVDQTRTDTTMNTKMKMTDRAGEVTEMQINGRSLGACDYTAEVDAQRRQVAAMEQQADEAQRQGERQVSEMCEQAVQNMQGMLFGPEDVCASHKARFCERLQTLEGYGVFVAAQQGMQQTPGTADPVAVCGMTSAALLGKLCPAAARGADLRFIGANCAAERPRFCTEALRREELWYISRYCDAERGQLVAQQCAGRQYSSQIAPRYRDFCTGALGADLGGGAADGSPEQ